MNHERNPVWIVLGIAAVVAGALWLYPRVQEELAPEPVRAWVAIEVADEGFAEVGWRRLERGTPFTLHAVLEARDRQGAPVYYTEARGLRLGGEVIPSSALRSWDRRRPPKILWFTVEAGYAFRETQSQDQIANFDLTEAYRPEWPRAWSIPGQLLPSWVQNPQSIYGVGGKPLGTQRFHVRIEVYEDDKALLPEARFKSWGAESLPDKLEEFPAVTVHVPGKLQAASEIFGLPQLEVPAGQGGLPVGLVDLSRNRLAFSRLTVLAETLEATGTDPSRLEWRPLELGSAPAWGSVVDSGDLFQVGERLVILFEDRGEPGVLDGEDLCFDFAKGAAIRPLGQIFGGDGEVRWASLSTP